MSAYNTNDTDPTMSAIRTILHEPTPAMDAAKARVTGILTTKRKAPAEKQVNAPKVESDQSRISAVMGRKKWAVTPKRKYAY